MNIFVVYDCEYPWDIRIEKIINSLLNKGHKVKLIARNKTGLPTYEEYEDLSIYRLPSFKNPKLTGLLNTTLFFNPIWVYKVYSVVKSTNCDLILIRDLPLAGVGIILSKLFNIPVIVDFAEPYPLTVRQRRKFEKFKIQHLITRNIWFSDVYEKKVIKHADSCFVVCEEAKERLISKGAKCHVAIVRNTPELRKFTPEQEYEHKSDDTFVIMYVGILIGGRGVEIAIKAMSKVVASNSNIKLVIIGSGKAEKHLKEKASQLNLNGCVEFLGWIDNELIPKYINKCDVGILPFSNTDHINHTIANKLFDFMAIGKPVICSNVRPMIRILEEAKCGYTFEADDDLSLAKTILDCYQDTEREKLGENGLNQIKTKYNWSIDEKSLLNVVEEKDLP
ncbi:MAG: glycosyltransferase family 4 protein [Candidatus Thiodiazotropha weberae]|nr:glycosyltransferase family 4 protein [Candidatus Thiodiazotropha lotti]MCG8012614.1 glycosyltransferase family 4 protein [Candidatus Thiodiazotropha lotti]MCW4212085.1 glycosyltransferase family 4 protein [Candidatus Thiodiazotropha lotti]MCW4215885.1 glycosyltransferase family 4 protein [Candidatus Thiodiazotropha lotti]